MKVVTKKSTKKRKKGNNLGRSSSPTFILHDHPKNTMAAINLNFFSNGIKESANLAQGSQLINCFEGTDNYFFCAKKKIFEEKIFIDFCGPN